MDLKKAESGAAKRAKKRKAQQAAISNTKKITTFLTKADSSADIDRDRQNSTEVREADAVPGPSPKNESKCDHDTDLQQVEEMNEATLSHETPNKSPISTDKTIDQAYMILDLTKIHPTDRGHFASNRPADSLMREILAFGPCRPKMSFPRNCDGRKFSKGYYTTKLPSGEEVQRTWLCYSPILNRVYCEPCWMFGNRADKNFRMEWVDGSDDWKHLSERIKVHERSSSHIMSMVSRNNIQSLSVIDRDLERQIQRESTYWRDVLSRIFNIILTLTKCNTALRGHSENAGDQKAYNQGNFLEVVNLMSKFDPVLHRLLSQDKHTVKYLSPAIQNEVISLLSTSVKKLICAEVNSAPFFALIVDSTLDCKQVDQISITLRFCVVAKNKLEIRESFLGFFESEDQSAKGFEDVIMTAMADNDIPIEKCRGQGYDGASTMSGHISGLQKRIRDRSVNADYVHCAAHNLNLTISDGAKAISAMTHFFDTLQVVFTFLHASAPRWSILRNIFTETFEKDKKTLNSSHSQANKIMPKKLCETRWEARHNAVYALKFRFVDILKALTQIVLLSKKSADSATASGIKTKLEKFEFILQLVLWQNVLRPLKLTSKHMQNSDMDIGNCVKLWENSLAELEALKSNPGLIFAEAKQLASRWGIKATYTQKRKVKRKRFFDECALTPEPQVEEEEGFIKGMIDPVLTKLIRQLHTRFEGMNRIFSLFSFLVPETLVSLSQEELTSNSDKLREKYQDDLSIGLTEQLLTFVSCMRSHLREVKTIRDLADILLQYEIADSFPEVYTTCMLYLTIPVTVASAERSFSKLKLIKNYLRSSMSQDRLSNISILNIESRKTAELDMNRLITSRSLLR